MEVSIGSIIQAMFDDSVYTYMKNNLKYKIINNYYNLFIKIFKTLY